MQAPHGILLTHYPSSYYYRHAYPLLISLHHFMSFKLGLDLDLDINSLHLESPIIPIPLPPPI